MSVDLDETGQSRVARDALIAELFSGVEFVGRDRIVHNGSSFTAVKGIDRAKAKLLSLFGGTQTLEQVDAAIASLVREQAGWLESTSDDQVEIKSGELSADVAQLVELVVSTLSADICSKVRALLGNISTILSSDQYFAQCRSIDVNIVSRDGSDVLVLHSRYAALTKSRRVHVMWFGGSKRSIQITLNARRVGLTAEFFDGLSSAEEGSGRGSPFIVRDGLVSREAALLPEQGPVVFSCSDPATSPNATPALQRRELLGRPLRWPNRGSLTPNPLPRTWRAGPVALAPHTGLSVPPLRRQLQGELGQWPAHLEHKSDGSELPELL